MITNLGKNVMAKFLIGQTPSYASHIAVGCGTKPLKYISIPIVSASKDASLLVTATTTSLSQFSGGNGLYPGLKVDISTGNSEFDVENVVITAIIDDFSFQYQMATGAAVASTNFSSASVMVNFQDKESLAFEMFRVPIVSRGYVKEDGLTKIVLTAEMPTQERYEITELGLYSAGSNPSATGYDSRTLYTFSRQEAWKTVEVSGGIATESEMYVIDEPLGSDLTTGDMDLISNVAKDGQDHKVFQTNATNRLFSNEYRKLRSEQLRYLNNMVLMRGNYSSLLSGQSEIDPTSSHISLATTTSLQKNASSDLVKLAFSVVNVNNSIGTDGYPTNNPYKASVMLRFIDANGKYAEMKYQTPNNYDWRNRYIVLEKELSNLSISSGFLWSQVSSITLHGVVLSDATTVSEDYYIGFDAVRLENITSSNPLYGLTAYSTIVTSDQLPIVKMPNTASMVEFRLGVGV